MTIKWTKDKIKILEKHTIREAAEILGISAASVRNHCNILGIDIKHKKRGPRKKSWNKEQIEIIRSAPTLREAGEKLGITRERVRQIRQKLGMPSMSLVKKVKVNRILEDNIELLRTEQTKDLAKKLGLPEATIRNKRKELGIVSPPRYPFGVTKVWPKEIVDLLGKVPDKVIREKTGMSLQRVHTKRVSMGIPPHPSQLKQKIDWAKYDHLLGTMPDAKLAKVMKCSQGSVSLRRAKLGIPSGSPRRMRWHKWTKKEEALLGTMSDAALGKKIGLSQQQVRWKRRKLQIPSHQEQKQTAKQRKKK